MLKEELVERQMLSADVSSQTKLHKENMVEVSTAWISK